MIRNLLVLCTLLSATMSFSQSVLVAGGETVAHGVDVRGEMPEALRALTLGRQLTAVPHSTFGQRNQHKAQQVRRAAGRASIKPIAPLLQSIRDQEAPYNDLCPLWTYEDGKVSDKRCLSGCVATSIEQIMAYYRYPEQLLDTLHGWETPNYTIYDMLPGTRFDWNNYLHDYRYGWTEAQGAAIALPTLAAGMAVHMKYGLYSSGANTYRAVEPLKRALGYGMAVHYERLLYTPERWHAMLQYELQQGRPIAYTGHNMTMGGHAFNIDGVDAQGFYHVNWGYNGCYDGWYDIDWLNPWEPTDVDPNGIAEGFFCNQGALFMNPSAEAKPLKLDSLDIDNLGIVLKDVTFLRTPDLQGYVAADFLFENTGSEAVTYTYEVMSYLPEETEIFERADYLGLSAITLQPLETRSQRVYLHFNVAGDRILGISHDDVTIPFTKAIHIDKGNSPKLVWGSVSNELAQAEDDTWTATFHIPVANEAPTGYAGELVTYCLYADGKADEDSRHFTVLSLPGGEQQTLEISFSGLMSDTHYTLLVRCPWPVKAQTDFRTPTATGIGETREQPAEKSPSTRYDISGRRTASRHGLMIEKGHKLLIPKQQ